MTLHPFRDCGHCNEMFNPTWRRNMSIPTPKRRHRHLGACLRCGRIFTMKHVLPVHMAWRGVCFVNYTPLSQLWLKRQLVYRILELARLTICNSTTKKITTQESAHACHAKQATRSSFHLVAKVLAAKTLAQIHRKCLSQTPAAGEPFIPCRGG